MIVLDTDALRTFFSLSEGALGTTVAIALWVTVIGALGAGILGQRLGGCASAPQPPRPLDNA